MSNKVSIFKDRDLFSVFRGEDKSQRYIDIVVEHKDSIDLGVFTRKENSTERPKNIGYMDFSSGSVVENGELHLEEFGKEFSKLFNGEKSCDNISTVALYLACAAKELGVETVVKYVNAFEKSSIQYQAKGLASLVIASSIKESDNRDMSQFINILDANL